jgi:hypothetical protein
MKYLEILKIIWIKQKQMEFKKVKHKENEEKKAKKIIIYDKSID